MLLWTDAPEREYFSLFLAWRVVSLKNSQSPIIFLHKYH